MKASVIIAAFNASETIERSVCSALGQAGIDLEVIVVNDSSTDATEQIVLRLAGGDNRVRLLQNVGVRGPSAARNTGIAASSGDWLVVLDSDDVIALDRLQGLIKQAESRRLDALADNLELLDYDTGISLGLAFPPQIMQRREPIDLKWLLQHDMPGGDHRTFGCCKPVIRAEGLRSAALTYSDDIRIGEDFLLYGQMLVSGLRFGVTPDVGYQYYLRPSSLIHSARNSDATIQVNSQLKRFWLDGRGQTRDPELHQLFREREAAFRYVDFIYALRSRQPGLLFEAARKLKVAFALKKFALAIGRRVAVSHLMASERNSR